MFILGCTASSNLTNQELKLSRTNSRTGIMGQNVRRVIRLQAGTETHFDELTGENSFSLRVDVDIGDNPNRTRHNETHTLCSLSDDTRAMTNIWPDLLGLCSLHLCRRPRDDISTSRTVATSTWNQVRYLIYTYVTVTVKLIHHLQRITCYFGDSEDATS